MTAQTGLRRTSENTMTIRFFKSNSPVLRVLRLAVLGFLLSGAEHAWAMVNCTYGPGNVFGNAAGNVTIPLLVGNLHAGRDMPNGTVLYRQTYNVPGNLVLTCDPGVGYDLILNRALASTPLPLANWNSAPYAGKVYQTGIDGIGIAIWFNSIAIPNSQIVVSGILCPFGPCNQTVSAGMLNFDISLIKTGAITAGTIDGSQLPTVTMNISETPYPNYPLTVLNAKFSGSITLSQPTCQTPNIAVDLGLQTLAKMTSVGIGSPWKQFNIALNNCPAFRGSYTEAGGGQPIYYNDGTSSISKPNRANSIQFQLDPVTQVIDKTNGVIGLAGNDAATGVGIQIARSGSTTGIQFGALLPSNLTLNTSATGNYVIPLQARYYRTNATATPGSGNASATFTIHYE
jgi:type 1 fimbria pilin